MYQLVTIIYSKVSLLGSIDSLVQRRNYSVLKSNFTYLWPLPFTFHSTTLGLYHQRTTCTLNWDQRKLWRHESCVQCAVVNSIFYLIVIVSIYKWINSYIANENRLSSTSLNKLHRIETAPLIGGWEERLNAEVTFSENASDVRVPKTAHEDTTSSWLWRHVVEQNITSLCLTGVRGFDAIRAEIQQSLITLLHDRLDIPWLASKY